MSNLAVSSTPFSLRLTLDSAMKSCCVGGLQGGNQRLAEDGQIANDFIVEISGGLTGMEHGREREGEVSQ